MNKLRIALLLAVVGFFSLVIYQNLGYLSSPAVLQLDLWVKAPFHTEKIKNAQLILGAFLVGFLIAYFRGLSARFQNSRKMQELTATIDSQAEAIAALKIELRQCQQPAAPPDSSRPEASEEIS